MDDLQPSITRQQSSSTVGQPEIMDVYQLRARCQSIGIKAQRFRRASTPVDLPSRAFECGDDVFALLGPRISSRSAACGTPPPYSQSPIQEPCSKSGRNF